MGQTRQQAHHAHHQGQAGHHGGDGPGDRGEGLDAGPGQGDVEGGGGGGGAVLAAEQSPGLRVGQAEELPPVRRDDHVGPLPWPRPGGVAGELGPAALVLQHQSRGPAAGGELEGAGAGGAVEGGEGGGVGGEDVAAREGAGEGERGSLG